MSLTAFRTLEGDVQEKAILVNTFEQGRARTPQAPCSEEPVLGSDPEETILETSNRDERAALLLRGSNTAPLDVPDELELSDQSDAELPKSEPNGVLFSKREREEKSQSILLIERAWFLL